MEKENTRKRKRSDSIETWKVPELKKYQCWTLYRRAKHTTINRLMENLRIRELDNLAKVLTVFHRPIDNNVKHYI